MGKLWQSPLDGHPSNNRGTKFLASQKESTQKRAVLHRNAGFYIVSMRNYTQRHERAVLHEKLRIFSFTRRMHGTFYCLNILSYISPTTHSGGPPFFVDIYERRRPEQIMAVAARRPSIQQSGD